MLPTEYVTLPVSEEQARGAMASLIPGGEPLNVALAIAEVGAAPSLVFAGRWILVAAAGGHEGSRLTFERVM